MTMMSLECRFLFILWLQANLVITGPHVQFSEPGGSIQFIKQLFDNRNWVFVFDCQGIELPVINAKAPSAVLFLN
jgi:hypothetical protein